MEPVFSHDEAQHVFIADVGGRQGTILYIPVGDRVVDFQSTYIPADLRQKGLGTQLVRFALQWAREHHLTVIPSCWFVRAVIEQEGPL